MEVKTEFHTHVNMVRNEVYNEPPIEAFFADVSIVLKTNYYEQLPFTNRIRLPVLYLWK